jgi:hypothetical protein
VPVEEVLENRLLPLTQVQFSPREHILTEYVQLKKVALLRGKST